MSAFLPPRLGRALAALPDLVTAIACLVVWVAPLAFGVGAVKTVVLMMLMEFLLVHGAGFFTGIAFMDDQSKLKRLAMMGGMLLFYALFVGAFAWSFGAWWPVWVFLWLVVGKAAWIFVGSRDRERAMGQQMSAWAFSVAAYLGAVFAGLMLPLPRLGITPERLPSLGLPGGGEWIERPHTAVAGMAMYYCTLAAFKFWRAGAAPARAGVAEPA